MRRTLIVLLVVVAFLAAGAGFAFGNANNDYYTGCVNPAGVLTKFAAGDEPLKACSSTEQQISLAGGAMAANGLAIAEFYDVKSEYFWVSPGSNNVGYVTCDDGDYVTGGGEETSNFQARVINSRPFYSGVPAVPGGWFSTVYNTGSTDITLEVWAMCADIPPYRG